MMHLSPAPIDQLKNSGRANVQIFHDFTIMICAAFPPHGPKYVARAVNRIIPKLNVNVRRTLEYPFIHLMRLISTTPNSSKRIINRDFIGVGEIFVHHLQIAAVKRAVELRQSLLRLAKVSEFLVTCDGLLYRLHGLSVHRSHRHKKNARWAAKPNITELVKLLRDRVADIGFSSLKHSWRSVDSVSGDDAPPRRLYHAFARESSAVRIALPCHGLRMRQRSCRTSILGAMD